ncbi:deazapurine DNA modification protein DpdA family protein [Pilimelia terevasa]|uniref:deazapurine DNA modification protein DpdA family protein n=1 Tax=Pilimelia terevasa TaxID=53372 RepID=UPI001E2BF44F|nr:hypothetical protein [Pilimelia terevasa]
MQQTRRWTIGPGEYVARLRRYRDEIGRLLWAAPQDWMCEPVVIAGGQVGPVRFAGTGLSVAEHQRRTVANFAQLRELAPDLPIIPVVQGWERDDYLRCVDLYDHMLGVDLSTAPLVGLGSVCRRQATGEAGRILAALHGVGVRRIHGFGFKTLGLSAHGHLLTSVDSLAWSLDARRRPRLPGCTTHRNCANCLRYALRWRSRVLAAAAPHTHQPTPLRKEAA